jgi:hypothetical protein
LTIEVAAAQHVILVESGIAGALVALTTNVGLLASSGQAVDDAPEGDRPTRHLCCPVDAPTIAG